MDNGQWMMLTTDATVLLLACIACSILFTLPVLLGDMPRSALVASFVFLCTNP